MNNSPFAEAIAAQETAREGWMAEIKEAIMQGDPVAPATNSVSFKEHERVRSGLAKAIDEQENELAENSEQWRNICLLMGFDPSEGEGISCTRIVELVKSRLEDITKDAEIDRLKKELGEAERSLFLWRDAKTDPPQLTGWYLVKLHGDREEDHAIIRVEEGFMEYQTGEPTEPDEWQAWAEFPAWINPEALTSQRQ